MAGIFWVATVAMALLASSFISPPLARYKSSPSLVITAIAVPIAAAILYLYLGSPEVVASSHAYNGKPAQATAPGVQQSAGGIDSVADLVDGLAARLQNDPSDGKSWLLLARSYHHLNRVEEARSAYSKASAQGQTDADFEALLLSGGLPDAPIGPYVSGRVSLSAEAQAMVDPNDTVFIFVRGAGATGAPAAVVRRSVSDLPADFRLDDSNAVIEGMKLSNYETVVVTARLARSGNAAEALQGLQAQTGPMTVADMQRIDLTIE